MPTTRRLLATGIAGASLALAPVAVAPAVATPAAPMPANAVTDCLGQGKIWLVVNGQDGKLMHNECVDKGATGLSLLAEGGVKTTLDSKGFICAMDGVPSTCPTKFDSKTPYWAYYTATKGGKWTYSTKGANTSTPKAGTLEGWCYGTSCTPTMPSLTDEVVSTASSSATPAAAPTTPKKSSHTGLVATIVVLVVLAAGGLVVARRRKA